MESFRVRSERVEAAGRVVHAWSDDAVPDQPTPVRWHLEVELGTDDPLLVNGAGLTNSLNRIECLVTPVEPYRGADFAHRLLPELVGQKVRIAGAWGDFSDGTDLSRTIVWPISWLLVDRGVTPIVEEHGFTQAVRDVDFLAFTDDSNPGAEDAPPHDNGEDRHVEVQVLFPTRPQTTAIPMFVECLDREDAERVLCFGQATPRPLYPIHAAQAHEFTIGEAPMGHALTISCDTGSARAGQGFCYTKLALTYDESFDTMCSGDVCLSDPDLSCQATDEQRLTYVWPRLASARSGDLIFGPAGTSGVLGKLLGALEDPQFFDHMAIFVADDGQTVRHCTASDDRTSHEDYYSSTLTVRPTINDILDPTDDDVDIHVLPELQVRVPLRGFREDILKYAWPGSITQTLGEIFLTGRNSANPAFGFEAGYPEIVAAEQSDPPSRWELSPSERSKRTAFHDPEAVGVAKRTRSAERRRRYSLTRLQKDPAWRPDAGAKLSPGGWLYPVLVRPHPLLTNAAHEALLVVAAEALRLRAHYRFFAYSDASIAINPSFNAPGAGAWGDEPGADWAAGTVAAVCSSFVWAAVQAANAVLLAAGRPTIELEGESESSDHRPTGSLDGIYRYTETERVKAGKALYEHLYTKVASQLDDRLADLPGVIDDLSAELNTIDGVPVKDQVRDYFGRTVANQLCNVFASDAVSDFEDSWTSTGAGQAVSPDDTMLRWDTGSPVDSPPVQPPGRLNVYGNATTVLIPRAAWRYEPVYRILPTSGHGSLRGTVVRRPHAQDVPERVIGSIVRFGCRTTATDAEGSFSFSDVKVGTYALQAGFIVADPVDHVGIEWKSKLETTTLLAGKTEVGVELELLPPPGVARDILVHSHHDIVDRRVVGTDDWKHVDMGGAVSLAFDPLDPVVANADQSNTRLTGVLDQTTPEVGSGVHVQVRVEARLKEQVSPDGAVERDGTAVCDMTLTFYDAGEGEVNARIEKTLELAPGASETMPYNLVSRDTVPERASGQVTVTNLVAVLA